MSSHAERPGQRVIRDRPVVDAPDRYAAGLITAACAATLPELVVASWPDALYRVRDRGGVGVIALAAGALDDRQLATLRRFRFAQYLEAGFVDAAIAHEHGLDEDRVAAEDAETIHFVAVSSQDGRLLGSMTLHAPARAPAETRLRAYERPLLPVETYFGWGVFNRLALLPDLPLERVREFGRFVKNRRLGPLKPLGIRAAVELCLAATHTLMGSLALRVEAFVGQFEDDGARRNLEFFHTPMVVLRGGLALPPPREEAFQAGFEGHDRHPFAVLVSDLASMVERVAAIEAALAQPDGRGLLALHALAQVPSRATSSLVPLRGVPALADTALPQRELTLPDRRCARSLGDRLRAFSPFASLSDTEATTLAARLARGHVRAGQPIVTRGRPSAGLVLVEEGRAEVRGASGLVTRTLGPGDCCGAASLLTGTDAAAHVVARCPMTVLRLERDTYVELVCDLPDVELALHRVALAELDDAR